MAMFHESYVFHLAFVFLYVLITLFLLITFKALNMKAIFAVMKTT